MRFGSITAKEGTILETLPFRVRIRVRKRGDLDFLSAIFFGYG
jgi:hypothetical protein